MESGNQVNGQSRNSDYFVGPPKSPWKGSQSEHDSISLGIRHLVRSENESSENETAIDDGMDCIGTVLKDLQLVCVFGSRSNMSLYLCIQVKMLNVSFVSLFLLRQD